MSDTALHTPPGPIRSHDWASTGARARVKRRYMYDRILQWVGLGSIGIGVLLLLILLSSLVSTGLPAFQTTKVTLDVFIDPKLVKPENPGKGNFRKVTRDAFAKLFPEVTSRSDQRRLFKIMSSGAPFNVRKYVINNPDVIGQNIQFAVPLSDPYDQLYKGVIPRQIEALSGGQVELGKSLAQQGLLSVEDGKTLANLTIFIDPELATREDPASGNYAPMLAEALKAIFPRASPTITSDILGDEATEAVKQNVIETPGLVGRTVQLKVQVSDHFDSLHRTGSAMIMNPRFGSPKVFEWYDSLAERNLLQSNFSFELFTNADSRFPEQAGLLGAIAGSFFSLLVCFLLSFVAGIAAAIYLEEFAPKNKLTDLIEVNINNLAAVPSVVFGLLGLAVFLGTFGMPRSSPLVGGMVLSLMTLPTIIIATRAALQAVPPSIREAALGVGASRHQVITHHVLPLAMPGILTGTIIGLAQALGETAPLLLIGMNAFIPSIESIGILEPATALPTQIFSWADSPERGFVSRTSAAILILLGFLFIMNATAIYLRQKFERRW
ncbi:MAG: phosphate ABC transporter permease PstA [Pseudomonadota bacterium]